MDAVTVKDIVDTVRTRFAVLDLDLTVVSANRAFYRACHVGLDDTVGRQLFDLCDEQRDNPELRRLLDTVVPRPEPWRRSEPR